MDKFTKVMFFIIAILWLLALLMESYNRKLEGDISQLENQKQTLMEEIINLEEVRESGESERLK